MSGSKWSWAALIVAILMLGVGGTLVSTTHGTGAAAAPGAAGPALPVQVATGAHPHATDVVAATNQYGGFIR